jgi:hypothetical protein
MVRPDPHPALHRQGRATGPARWQRVCERVGGGCAASSLDEFVLYHAGGL